MLCNVNVKVCQRATSFMLVVSGAGVEAGSFDKSTDEPGRASCGSPGQSGVGLVFDPETTNMKLVARGRELPTC
jgi:hypothetical protein